MLNLQFFAFLYQNDILIYGFTVHLAARSYHAAFMHLIIQLYYLYLSPYVKSIFLQQHISFQLYLFMKRLIHHIIYGFFIIVPDVLLQSLYQFFHLSGFHYNPPDYIVYYFVIAWNVSGFKMG